MNNSMYATYLPIRLVSQRNNYLRFEGTCNVTSLAMALSHTLPSTSTVSADGLFALLAVVFQNEKLLVNTKKNSTVTQVISGLLREGSVENAHDLEGIVRSEEFINPNPSYFSKVLPNLGKEEAVEGEPKGQINFHVTNEELYRNIWYKVRVNRKKKDPPVSISGGFLENKAKWDGEPQIEKVALTKEFQRVPLGVMRINTYAESLRETGRVVAGMAAAHGTVLLDSEEEGKPVLLMGNQRHDLSHGSVWPELVQEMLPYRNYGKKYVKDAPTLPADKIIERIRNLITDRKVAIVSGRFTHRGHLVVACGYVETEGQITGIVVADPWGKGTYDGVDDHGGRNYLSKASDSLIVYEAESFKRAFKYIAAEFVSLDGKRPLKRGSVTLKSMNGGQVALVAPMSN
ncbi:hypothetical protein F7731_22380 [Cytobacillus depressus]|uniref:Peptidase C39-like domain-containing protein n=1 Tax=Cytobacillus depressus TaxID=1602942 RepID=A0A6L3V1K8_9BACI|nr:hypothetical protein [Cytobacillus depressus]KAB2329591.1 hypothetical protein F7731_22380 [Cytobacillus depressus]